MVDVGDEARFVDFATGVGPDEDDELVREAGESLGRRYRAGSGHGPNEDELPGIRQEPLYAWPLLSRVGHKPPILKAS